MQKVTSSFKDRGVVFGVDLRNRPTGSRASSTRRSGRSRCSWTRRASRTHVRRERHPHSVVIGRDGTIRNVHVDFGGAEKLEKELTEELEAALADGETTG